MLRKSISALLFNFEAFIIIILGMCGIMGELTGSDLKFNSYLLTSGMLSAQPAAKSGNLKTVGFSAKA